MRKSDFHGRAAGETLFFIGDCQGPHSAIQMFTEMGILYCDVNHILDSITPSVHPRLDHTEHLWTPYSKHFMFRNTEPASSRISGCPTSSGRRRYFDLVILARHCAARIKDDANGRAAGTITAMATVAAIATAAPISTSTHFVDANAPAGAAGTPTAPVASGSATATSSPRARRDRVTDY